MKQKHNWTLTKLHMGRDFSLCQQVNTWKNDDEDIWCHQVPLGHDEFNFNFHDLQLKVEQVLIIFKKSQNKRLIKISKN